MKSVTSWLLTILAGLIVVAALAPSLISLSHALVPLVAAVGIVAVIVRLVFFHTRRW